ncbi:serine/threonine protein kinase [Streptomyces zinciresistens K42]|uniref:Serine/threonine protein kinase n=1 Tax=Streptomyces zinciresistens K42 TaxID=700597 RepID=G2G3V3_9ACTN|nr:protein kinase [Streptomyces zinciresistens]EGX61849.1 serine/threonine protein kinase [Streptomyces zinciresistens K42]
MNDDSTRMLGGRYRLSVERQPEIADAPVMHGVDMLSGHEVTLTRVVLPETLTTDPLVNAPTDTSPDGPQAEEPVRTAYEAVRALTRLPDHPHLAQVFDVLIEGETLWIVSERVPARPMSVLLRRAALTPLRAAEIAREILRALRHLHARGWLHRNITADTVFIGDDGGVLIDGLAQSVAEEALCGHRPRPLPHPHDDETARRTPLHRPESSPEPGFQTQLPWPGRLPAGFTPARGGGGSAALRADAQRQAAARPSRPADHPATASRDRADPPPAPCDAADDFPGPVTALEARRALDARMVRIGAVTERWAPEQAAPVTEAWQLAPPLGPGVDLWALGVLLFRALQGHPPYPEEDVEELVDLVCADPPAFAEDCGELRAVIESLLRQDPAQRLSIDETDRWLVSLLRAAREPAPPSEPAEEPASRLPVLRFRGHLVRRRPAGPVAVRPGRHRRTRTVPRLRGRTLLIATAVPLALGATVYVALAALPRTGQAGAPDTPATKAPTAAHPTGPPAASAPPSGQPPADSARDDPAGFQLAVGTGWKRHAEPLQSRVRFTRDDLTLIVVPGRDTVDDHPDPLDYQKAEPELAAYRADPACTADGVRRVEIGTDQALAEGRYTYADARGTVLYARNQAAIISGRYHVIFVVGPAAQRERVAEVFDRAIATYQPPSQP